MLIFIDFTLTAFSFFFLSSSFFFLLSGIRSSSQLSSLLVKHKSISLRMNTKARTLREPEIQSFILSYLNQQKHTRAFSTFKIFNWSIFCSTNLSYHKVKLISIFNSYSQLNCLFSGNEKSLCFKNEQLLLHVLLFLSHSFLKAANMFWRDAGWCTYSWKIINL